MGMSSFLISGTMQQFCGLSSTTFVFSDSSQSKPARNAWCRHIVPFCKELGSDNLTQECQLGGSLAGKLSARVLSIALSFLCASLHSSIPRSSALRSNPPDSRLPARRLPDAEPAIFSFVVIAQPHLSDSTWSPR